MMTRPITEQKKTHHAAALWQAGGIAITTLLASSLLNGPAVAQSASAASGRRVTIREIKASRLPIEPTLHQVPAAAQPVFNRAADMLRLAEKQTVSAPANARPAFAGAVHDLRQMLYIGGYSPNVAYDGSSSIGNTISSRDVAQDVRTMRSAALQAPTSSDAQLLRRAANLYASAARNMITGDIRTALVEPGAAPSIRVLDQYARADRRSAQAGTNAAGIGRSASSELPPVATRPTHRTSGRPVTVVIHGGVQDQRLARQQGQQALRDIVAAENNRNAAANTAATAAVPTVPAYGSAANTLNGPITANSSPVLTQQAALAAAQQAAAAQAYMNQGQNQLFPYGYYPNVYGYGAYGSPLTPYGGSVVPAVPSSMPTYPTSPINGVTPAGGVVLGPGMSLIPNPLFPTQISPQPILTLPTFTPPAPDNGF